MDKFNRGGFGGNRGGGSKFGGNRGGGFGGNKFGNRERREVTMHDAVCDACHKKCQVPFRPSGDKPVYCSDCFGGKRDDAPRQSFDKAPRRDFAPRQDRDSEFGGGSNDVKKQLEAMNIKLDSLIKALETISKPVEVKEKTKVKKIGKK